MSTTIQSGEIPTGNESSSPSIQRAEFEQTKFGVRSSRSVSFTMQRQGLSNEWASIGESLGPIGYRHEIPPQVLSYRVLTTTTTNRFPASIDPPEGKETVLAEYAVFEANPLASFTVSLQTLTEDQIPMSSTCTAHIRFGNHAVLVAFPTLITPQQEQQGFPAGSSTKIMLQVKKDRLYPALVIITHDFDPVTHQPERVENLLQSGDQVKYSIEWINDIDGDREYIDIEMGGRSLRIYLDHTALYQLEAKLSDMANSHFEDETQPRIEDFAFLFTFEEQI